MIYLFFVLLILRFWLQIAKNPSPCFPGPHAKARASYWNGCNVPFTCICSRPISRLQFLLNLATGCKRVKAGTVSFINFFLFMIIPEYYIAHHYCVYNKFKRD